MNNSNNNKKIGMALLRQTQILSQNNAITPDERTVIASCIQEGMATGTYNRLKEVLFEVLATTALPEVVEEMLLEI